MVIADVNQKGGDALAHELGKDVLFVKTDVSSWSNQAALFKEAFAWGGHRLDFFAANAGIADRQSIYDVAKDTEADPMPLNLDAMKVNLDGVIQGIWLFIHYARRNKQPGGKVVITSSAAGLYPMDTCPQYSASKHAVSASPFGRVLRNIPAAVRSLIMSHPPASRSHEIFGAYPTEGEHHCQLHLSSFCPYGARSKSDPRHMASGTHYPNVDCTPRIRYFHRRRRHDWKDCRVVPGPAFL